MKALSGKQYTARELAERFGCGVKTIHNHGNALFGKTENGKRRYFDEAQVTAILERIKISPHGGRSVANRESDLVNSLQGTETTLTLDFQIALAERNAKELWKRKALEQETRAAKAEYQLSMTRELLHERETGLETYQRIAEAAGLAVSDRDDLGAPYRRYAR